MSLFFASLDTIDWVEDLLGDSFDCFLLEIYFLATGFLVACFYFVAVFLTIFAIALFDNYFV